MDLLKSIQVFQEVVKQKSFSKAANKLNLVPSAVTRQVNELEKYFDCKLLNRTTRALSLTDEGYYCLSKFEHILQEINSVSNELKERKENLSGHLNLTSPVIFSKNYFLKLISGFLKEYPNVSINWLIVNRFVNMVEEGFDIAVRAGQLNDSNLIMRKIGQFYLKNVASPDYLERKGIPQKPEELEKHDCIIDSSIVSPYRWNFSDKNKSFSLIVNSRINTNDPEVAVTLAKDGLGIAWLPEIFVNEYIKKNELVEVLKDYKVDPYPISLVYQLNSKKSLVIKTFIDYFLENNVYKI